MKLTVLTENTSECGLPAEHGLSLYLETKTAKILFDTGQSDLFAANAARLGVDLSAVQLCVLSHGHYDHGGGLSAFLRMNPTAPVYLSRYAFEPHFNALHKDIGLDTALMQSDRIRLTDGTTPIGEGLTLYACHDRIKKLDMGSAGLGMMQDGKIVADDFRHEHYLLIEEDGKRVLISGCSHMGVVNIEDWFRPDVLVGGFHLMKEPVGDTLRAYARMLDGYETDYYTCHCTGTEQYRAMKPLMKRLHYLSVGMTVEL